MGFLLDTHALIWLAEDNPRLGPRARAAVLPGVVLLSAIAVWEIAIKQRGGRIEAAEVLTSLEQAGFPELALTTGHARRAAGLPAHHRDPFDRALIAQAQAEGLVLVTADAQIASYDVALLDASR